METACRQAFLPLLALTVVPPVFFVRAPTRVQAVETSSFLLAAAEPTARFTPSVPWAGGFKRRLTTCFTKNYPSYDFSPSAQKLDRIHGACSLETGGAQSGRWSLSQGAGVSCDWTLRVNGREL